MGEGIILIWSDHQIKNTDDLFFFYFANTNIKNIFYKQKKKDIGILLRLRYKIIFLTIAPYFPPSGSVSVEKTTRGISRHRIRVGQMR